MARRNERATPLEVVKIGELIPDAANVRKHGDRNKSAIKNSLKRFGPGRSIVLDKDNVIVAGNGTMEGAPEAGIDEVLIVEPRPNQIVAVRRPDWTKTEAAAYGIADNRTAELAEWSFEDLGRQMKALKDDGIDLGDTGWEPHEVDPLLAADWSPPKPQGDDPTPPAGKGDHPYTVHFEPEKFRVIEQACDLVRANEGDEDIPTARCLELICGNFLSDPNFNSPGDDDEGDDEDDE